MLQNFKNIVLLILCLNIGFSVFAQYQPKKWALGAGINLRDFDRIPSQQYDSIDFEPGIHLWIYRKLGSSFSLRLESTLPTQLDQISDSTTLVDGGLLVGYHLNNGYILKEQAVFAPYLLAGAGVSTTNFETSSLGYQIPLGLGFQVRLWQWGLLYAEGQYKLDPVDEGDYFVLNGGLGFRLGKGDKSKDIEENEDSDGDGVADILDDCPEDKGSIAMNGCPDRDRDGVSDASDDCPDIPGLPLLAGCPDNDDDLDGVSNEADDCPNTPGLAVLGGCPDQDGDYVADADDLCPTEKGKQEFDGCPDTDNDGVPDSKDPCPFDYGPLENQGCPGNLNPMEEALVEITKHVTFQPASAILNTEAFGALDSLSLILVNNPTYHLRISGHTDAQGNEKTNLDLSRLRAKACFDYLVEKGISSGRMLYQGYGEMRPIADNFFEAGQAINRRVEFELFTP